jgi:hypothetical protein
VSVLGLVALVVAGTAVGVWRPWHGNNAAAASQPAFIASPAALTTPSGFTITSPSPGPVLHLGTATPLTLTAHNPFSLPITVTSFTVAVKSPVPAGCDASNLSLNGTTMTSPVTVAESLNVPASGTASAAPSLKLIDKTTTNQNSCKHVSFNFTYSGTAQYTDSTGTTLTSSLNPSSQGQSVTLTATVSPTYTESSNPTGVVTFYQCTTPTCTAYVNPALGTGALSPSGVATLPITTLPVGTDTLQATYPGAGTNFGASASSPLTQTVGAPGCTSLPTTTATTVITGNYTTNYEVTSGKSLWLNGGAIKGNLTVDAGGKFVGTNGSISGNLTSAGAMSLTGTAVKGNLSITGGTVGCESGTTISGNLTVQSLTGTTAASICGLTIKGNLAVQSNQAPITIGGSSTCLGNAISGNLTVQSNHGKVTIGGTGSANINTSKGNIAVSSNTGGGTLTGNTASGNCTLSGNSPTIVGSGNTTKGTNTCNRSA